MGTFHANLNELHGITVVAVGGDTVYVGRCHDLADGQLLLLDADQHTEGQEGRSNREYLERAARFGVWKKHDRLALPLNDLQEVTPLGSYYEGVGKPAVPEQPKEAAPDQAADAPLREDGAAGPVSLTDHARAEVRRLLAEQDRPDVGVRLGVSGGGCSGLVYQVEFDTSRQGDIVVEEEGFQVLLDRKSVIYLRGVTLDFQGGLAGRGFQFRNPNASNTCGCGESFAV